jgi:hypothetical protein
VCGKFLYPEASDSSSICVEAFARICSTSLNTHSPIRRCLGSSSQSETDSTCAISESHKLKSILLATTGEVPDGVERCHIRLHGRGHAIGDAKALLDLAQNHNPAIR